MKILLFGMNGQLGWELQRSLAPLGQVVALSSASTAHCGNLADIDGLRRTMKEIMPDVVVNAAAYTAVDQAERDMDLARTINALAPAALAQEAQQRGAWFVHYSTDYVFDGSGDRPWREDDRTGPLSVYGRTKLEGENLVRAAGGNHLIFRTSWVYAARGGNFARTMLRLARERDQLRVIDDQIGAPTGADLLADVTAHAIRAAAARPQLGGLYHVAAQGETSWHGYARFVIDHARQSGASLKVAPQAVVPIPASAYPLPAARPANSRLDTAKLREAFQLHLPEWQSGVARMLDEIDQTGDKKTT